MRYRLGDSLVRTLDSIPPQVLPGDLTDACIDWFPLPVEGGARPWRGAAWEDRLLERLLRTPERQDLLILDELGYVPFTKAGAELLFEVVSRACERQSLVVTTNLPFEQWLVIGEQNGSTSARNSDPPGSQYKPPYQAA